MIGNKAASLLAANSLRKMAFTPVRTNYPLTKSLVIKRKSADALSRPEKYAWWAASFVVIFSVPVYVLYNLNTYKGKG